MTKKRSVSNSHLTSAEIERHLADKNQSSEEKRKYLARVLKHQGLLSEGTKKEVFKMYGDLMNESAKTLMRRNIFWMNHTDYYSEGFKDYFEAARAYEQAGDLKKAEIAYLHATTYGRDALEGKDRRERKRSLPDKEDVDMATSKYRELHGPTKIYSNNKRDNPHKGLTSSLSLIIAAVGIGTGIFFLSSKITGNVIANLNQTSSNWIGGALFALGLTGALIYFKLK